MFLVSKYRNIYVPCQEKVEHICYNRNNSQKEAALLSIISIRIDETITDGNITVKELAENLGYSRQQITRWRAGKSEPTATVLAKLCEIYGVSADYILGLPKGMNWPR